MTPSTPVPAERRTATPTRPHRIAAVTDRGDDGGPTILVLCSCGWQWDRAAQDQRREAAALGALNGHFGLS